MVICLERCADLHMFQLMPLTLTVSCFSKIQIGFAFLVPAHPGIVPDKGPLNACVCVGHKDDESQAQDIKCKQTKIMSANVFWRLFTGIAQYIMRLALMIV